MRIGAHGERNDLIALTSFLPCCAWVRLSVRFLETSSPVLEFVFAPRTTIGYMRKRRIGAHGERNDLVAPMSYFALCTEVRLSACFGVRSLPSQGGRNICERSPGLRLAKASGRRSRRLRRTPFGKERPKRPYHDDVFFGPLHGGPTFPPFSSERPCVFQTLLSQSQGVGTRHSKW